MGLTLKVPPKLPKCLWEWHQSKDMDFLHRCYEKNQFKKKSRPNSKFFVGFRKVSYTGISEIGSLSVLFQAIDPPCCQLLRNKGGSMAHFFENHENHEKHRGDPMFFTKIFGLRPKKHRGDPMFLTKKNPIFFRPSAENRCETRGG